LSKKNADDADNADFGSADFQFADKLFLLFVYFTDYQTNKICENPRHLRSKRLFGQPHCALMKNFEMNYQGGSLLNFKGSTPTGGRGLNFNLISLRRMNFRIIDNLLRHHHLPNNQPQYDDSQSDEHFCRKFFYSFHNF
jgi:hypothetical protein